MSSKELQKGCDEKELKSKWAVKASVVLVLMRIKFNNHSSVLGELCLTTGMSGIDQQFIHHIHPLAIILILAIRSLLARRSKRISTIISRGIIHVIFCYFYCPSLHHRIHFFIADAINKILRY